MKKFILIPFMFLAVLPVFAQDDDATEQEEDHHLVQFSGVVLTPDSLDPVAFATIYERHSRMGTTTDLNGYFSFVAEKGDTILFQCLGFRSSTFIIPDTLSDYRYSIIQMMEPDTITLPEYTRRPWPSKEDFAEAFVNLDVSDYGYDAARKNLRETEMLMRMNAVANDSYLNYKWEQTQEQQRLYYAGQAAPISLLDPTAWARFIKAWKSGAFSNN